MTDDLHADLQGCADDLRRVIEAAKERHAATAATWPTVWPRPSVWEATDPNGRPLLADLLVARAQVLAALASKESK